MMYVVTVDNCREHGDYTVDQLCSHRAAKSCQHVTTPSLSSHRVVTLVGNGWKRSFAVYIILARR